MNPGEFDLCSLVNEYCVTKIGAQHQLRCVPSRPDCQVRETPHLARTVVYCGLSSIPRSTASR